jgi:hypothetical protein
MATIYTNSDDGWVYYKSTLSWSAAHNSVTGTSADDNDSWSPFPVATYCTSGRGSTTYYIYRAFLAFNTSDIGVAPSAATLKVYGYSNNSGDIIAIEGTWDGDSLATSNFNDFTGNTLDWDSTTVTRYSSEISSWSTSGYNDISLNSDALTAMANNDILSIVLVNHTYDYSNTDPDLGGRSGCQSEKNGFYFTDYTGTDRDPYIDYTSGGYGNDPLGHDMDDIDSNVTGVNSARIKRIMGR